MVPGSSRGLRIEETVRNLLQEFVRFSERLVQKVSVRDKKNNYIT